VSEAAVQLHDGAQADVLDIAIVDLAARSDASLASTAGKAVSALDET
jgi:hypothetical protein